ncbi:putative mitochondrial protein [Sesamum alatum]|uniref:Mitochondrial protein n=1 Tax=Sesamum alatum TaxID=300844 RepID=A0AAE1Y241_9LAMI|nr:putative mitochondrial protein [Sesamum alatum]
MYSGFPDLGLMKSAWKLTEDEKSGMVLPRGLWHADSSSPELCLVGRLLSNRLRQFETLDVNTMHVGLNWCDFFVHIHDFPLSMMNLGIVTHIGNRICRFRDMEIDDSAVLIGRFTENPVVLNRRLNWLAWDKLCRWKEDGGLGIRRLKELNLALVAKQAWQVAMSIDGLLAALEGWGRPFHHDSRSPVAARPNNFQLVAGPASLPEDSKVEALITHNNGWDVDLVRAEFHSIAIECILEIELRDVGAKDNLSSTMREIGASQCVAYHLARHLASEGGPA